MHQTKPFAEDETLAETDMKAVFGTEITTYTDNIKPGYKLSKVVTVNENNEESAMPLVISSNRANNIIRVYYIYDDLGYEVHYFFDGEMDQVMTERYNSTIGQQISDYTDKCKDGY